MRGPCSHVDRATRFVPTCLALALFLTAPAIAHAQSRPRGALSGTVIGSDSAPIPDVLVQLRRETGTGEGITYVARTDDDGYYRFAAVGAGRYTVVGKRIGFDSAAAAVQVADTRVQRDLVLASRGYGGDTVRVRARFAGVTGVVGDFALMAPMSGASVRILGGDPPSTTDSTGRFAIELTPGRSYALRVERTGYAPQLMAFTLPTSHQRLEVAVLLDSAARPVKDGWKWAELDQRQRVNRYGSAHISRAELRETEATNLHVALQYTAAAGNRGLTIPRAPCVFIDGVAKPTLTLDAVAIARVEFIELYTRVGDVSGTLATRWPAGFPCGDGPSFTNRTVFTTRRGNSNQAQYVVIWTRAP